VGSSNEQADCKQRYTCRFGNDPATSTDSGVVKVGFPEGVVVLVNPVQPIAIAVKDPLVGFPEVVAPYRVVCCIDYAVIVEVTRKGGTSSGITP
jgi:hypothetical protein